MNYLELIFFYNFKLKLNYIKLKITLNIVNLLKYINKLVIKLVINIKLNIYNINFNIFLVIIFRNKH
jgi:hypothetical protein